MAAYYNECDPYAAQWLRNLIAAGHIAPGEVDERSIRDVSADDLTDFDQCHFFAGIGIWSKALRDAGWPDDAPVWTGSCPCQPFSAAGQQKGFDDDRHLWPTWFSLVQKRRPAIVLGEQVASALAWLDLVSADLEGAGYAFGASDLCAAGYALEGWEESAQQQWLLRAIRDCPDPVVAGQLRDFADWACGNLGAHDGDHIRQRAYFVGVANSDRNRHNTRITGNTGAKETARSEHGNLNDRRGPFGRLADFAGGNPGAEWQQRGREYRCEPQDVMALRSGDSGELSRTNEGLAYGGAPMLRRTPVDWLHCRDGKWRPVEPGTFPLADAAPQRVGRLRAYGNGLDLETATQFCGAVKDALAEL